MVLDVIGVGYGRTGTLSLKIALEQLGFGPCQHAFELYRYPEVVERWERRLDGTADWEEVFAGYRSTTDFPSTVFWKEIVEHHPDARVVLTTRDSRRWFESVRTSVLDQMDRGELGPRARSPLPADRLMGRLMAEQHGGGTESGGDANDASDADEEASDGAGGFDFHDADAMIARFEQHNADVRATVPQDRLLEFEVSEGWGPLCEFLSVPLPDTEFPRRNDTEEFRRLLSEFG